jgi:hypothetical protein
MKIDTKQLLENSVGKGNNGADITLEFETPTYDQAQQKLYVKCLADGSGNKKYEVKFAFYEMGMSYQEFLDGKWIDKDLLLSRPIKVDCKCPSYVYGGILKANQHNNCALYTHADFTHYKKKTDRQEKNPENIPYGCKHIVSAIKALMSNVTMMEMAIKITQQQQTKELENVG